MTDAEISRTLALAWGLAAAPQRGPKRELSLERIVDAAIEIADTEGLAAVTMQRVAQTFEFSTMALYRYVATKDELYQLMLDAAMAGRIDPLEQGGWRAGLHTVLRALVTGYRSHPWALDIPLRGDIHLMPGQMRAADFALRAMRTLPASAPTKLAVLIMLSAHARGFASVEREVLASVEPGPETRALIDEAVTVTRFPDLAPLVRNGVYFGENPTAQESPEPTQQLAPEKDAEQLFEFSAAVLLAGLEQALAGLEEAESEQTVAPAPASPQQEFEAAEARLREGIELRKLAQQRVRDLEREEQHLRKERDRLKELAKAHAKHSRSRPAG